MMMDEIQKALKERYSNIHPLLFHRSVEKSASNAELFDILDSIPNTLPVMWDDELRRWVSTELLQNQNLENKS